MGSSEQAQQNPIAKVAGHVIGGSTAAREVPVEGNVVECGGYHPAQLTAARVDGKPAQLCGDVWGWTRSAYPPYPGFCPAAGSLGAYNGTFRCDQYVLSGGSCATSRAHVRATNRNYFPAGARWQLAGIRLANEAAR